MDSQVNLHGVKAGCIQSGSVQQLSEALPALAWEELQPRREVLCADGLPGQAAIQPRGCTARVAVREGIPGHSNLGCICLQSMHIRIRSCSRAIATECNEDFDLLG